MLTVYETHNSAIPTTYKPYHDLKSTTSSQDAQTAKSPENPLTRTYGTEFQMPAHSPSSPSHPRPSIKGESLGAATQAPANDAISSKGVVVSVRLSPAEAAAFDAVVSALGFGSRSDCLRAVIRSGVGMVEHGQEEQRAFGELRNAVAELGVGVNQLVRAVRSDRMALDGAERDVLFDLSNQMSRLAGYLHSLVQEGRRKQVKLFKAFLKGAQDG